MRSVSSRVEKLEQQIPTGRDWSAYSLEKMKAIAREYMGRQIGRSISDVEYDRFKDLVLKEKMPISEITEKDLVNGP